MNTTTIEMVSYQLKSAVSMEELERSHAQLNTFCLAQPGFLYRSVSQNEQQVWFEVVYWRSMEDAKSAGEAFRLSLAGQSWLSIIDERSVKMQHRLVDAQAYSNMLAMYAGQI
jgi:hypothetical protein